MDNDFTPAVVTDTDGVSVTDSFPDTRPDGAEASADEAESAGETVEQLYQEATRLLSERQYSQAADIYNRIIAESEEKAHAAYWGLFLVDEWNFNIDEKLLQYCAFFPFRGGSESMRREILGNQNLEKALNNAPQEQRKYYNDEAVKYTDNLYAIYREGIDNIADVAERKYDMLKSTFETTGICAGIQRSGQPSDTGVKEMTDKYYFRFSANHLNILHLDVYSIQGIVSPSHTFWHYRHVLMSPENGILTWSEFREFHGCTDAATIYGELDSFHRVGFLLLALWRDKMIIRSGSKVYFCRAAEQSEQVRDVFDLCYNTICVPVVENPSTRKGADKFSEFYKVAPIIANYETSKKSKWVRKTIAGCYIATAVYGDADAPQVAALRRFRDTTLLRSRPGRAFVNAYYRLSPAAARRLRPSSPLTRLFRRILDGIVEIIGGADGRR